MIGPTFKNVKEISASDLPKKRLSGFGQDALGTADPHFSKLKYTDKRVISKGQTTEPQKKLASSRTEGERAMSLNKGSAQRLSEHYMHSIKKVKEENSDEDVLEEDFEDEESALSSTTS